MNSLRLRTSILACAFVTLASPSVASAAGCAGENLMPSVSNVQEVRDATFCLLNQERVAAGLPTFTQNAVLESVAQPTAQDMVNRRYFAHVPPEGTTLQQKLAAFITGTSQWTIGENLAWGEGSAATPANTMVAWMNSPGHRANIMNGGFAEVGLGIVPGTPTGSAVGATYANHFGTRGGSSAGAAPETEAGELAPLQRRVRRCKTVKLKGKAARAAKRSRRKSTKRVCKYVTVQI